MKELLTEWRKYINEIRFAANNPQELGTIADELIERFFNGEMEQEEVFSQLKDYFASVASTSEMDVDSLIDLLINKKYSSQLKYLLSDPKYREMLKPMKEADDFDWDAFGFSDEETGESEGQSPHYKDLVGLDRGDTFTIGNRKPVYRVLGALTDRGTALGSQTKLVVIDGSGERKPYEIRTTGDDYEVGAFGKDEDNEHTVLIGKTGFVMNITKVSEDI